MTPAAASSARICRRISQAPSGPTTKPSPPMGSITPRSTLSAPGPWSGPTNLRPVSSKKPMVQTPTDHVGTRPASCVTVRDARTPPNAAHTSRLPVVRGDAPAPLHRGRVPRRGLSGQGPHARGRRSLPAASRSCPSGGLGRDPQAAPGRGDADPGNRPASGHLEEHGEAGAGHRPAADVLAAAQGLGGRRGRTADPGAFEADPDDADDRQRRRSPSAGCGQWRGGVLLNARDAGPLLAQHPTHPGGASRVRRRGLASGLRLARGLTVGLVLALGDAFFESTDDVALWLRSW